MFNFASNLLGEEFFIIQIKMDYLYYAGIAVAGILVFAGVYSILKKIMGKTR